MKRGLPDTDGISVKPYVKLYSKAEVRRLLKQYEIEDISIHQLKADHFWPPVSCERAESVRSQTRKAFRLVCDL